MPEPAATYWSYWGLREAPFRAAAGSDSYHLSPTHEEALARLHFLVENRRRLGLLLGDLGSGKTLLLSRFAAEIRTQGVDAVFLAGFGIRDGELLSAVLEGLSLGPRREESERVLWGRLADHLAERRYQRTPAVLILDDADAAREDALTAVVRLLKLDATAAPQVTVVLSAEPRCAGRLGARLLDMAELRIDLERWTAEETCEFVQQTLAQAGHAGQLFEPPAVKRLHELAGGRPRRVGQIADLALVAAAGQQRASIDAATIETVFRELTATGR